MKKALLLLSLGLSAMNLYSQVKFVKHYGAFSGEGNSIILNSYHNYIVAGQKNDQFSTYELNASGDTLWMKHYGTTSSEKAIQIIQTADGGYASIGSSSTTGNGVRTIYFVKTTDSGALSWTKQYGGLGQENGTSLVQLSTGEYMIGGKTKYNSQGLFDFYLLKTSSMGDTLWTKKIGGAQNDELNSMKQTSDGGFILCGNTESYTNGSKDYYLVKTDANGDTLWTKHYGGSSDELPKSVRQTSDGGYIMTGYSNSFGYTTQNMYVVKTNATGDTLWTKTYGQAGRYSIGGDIIQTSDGGYATTGLIKTAGATGGYDAYLVKINSSGTVEWEREFKVEPTNTAYTSSEGHSIIQTQEDGGYAITGNWFSGSTFELLVIKTDGNGIVGIREHQTQKDYSVFPNPFTQSAIIHFENPKNETYTLSLYNSEGRLVQNTTNTVSNTIEIQRGNLACGLYFFQLQSAQGMRTTGKLMIE